MFKILKNSFVWGVAWGYTLLPTFRMKVLFPSSGWKLKVVRCSATSANYCHTIWRSHVPGLKNEIQSG